MLVFLASEYITAIYCLQSQSYYPLHCRCQRDGIRLLSLIGQLSKNPSVRVVTNTASEVVFLQPNSELVWTKRKLVEDTEV